MTVIAETRHWLPSWIWADRRRAGRSV